MDYTHSTPARKKSKAGKRKPTRPPGFPLFAHASGQWAKRVKSKVFYFGVWDDRQAALEKWLREKDDRLAGRTPRNHDPDALTVIDLGELFLQSRERRVQTGEMSDKTLAGYVIVVKKVVAALGANSSVEQLVPEDFARLRTSLAKGVLGGGVNLKSLEGWIAVARAMFNHADKNGLIERSLSKIWGTEFAKPSRTALTKLSNQTTRLFDADEIRRLLELATVPMRSMILLGVNAGFGNTDCASVSFDSIDLKSGWLTLQRSKTGKMRRVPLWPETVQALRAAIAARPEHKDKADAELIFITKSGGNWIPCPKDNPPAKEFAKLRKLAGITGKGKSFYSMRHVFQTVADETKDFIAVSSIMGHAATSISDHYREKIGDDRLQAVTNHVRAWLFPKPVKVRKAKVGAV